MDPDQVRAATGIPEELLTSLEREDYKLFFSDADVRSHLRVYARFLDLELPQVLALYESARPATAETALGSQQETAALAPEPAEAEPPSQLFRNLVWILSATLILAILATATLLLITPR